MVKTVMKEDSIGMTLTHKCGAEFMVFGFVTDKDGSQVVLVVDTNSVPVDDRLHPLSTYQIKHAFGIQLV